MYSEKVSEFFKNIPINIPECKPDAYNKKRKMLLTDIVVIC